MIVCHCNRIDHLAIEAAAEAIVAADPYRLLTPVGVYKALGHRPRCGQCLTLAANIIRGRCPNNGDCRTCPLAEMCDAGPGSQASQTDDADALVHASGSMAG